MESSKSRATTAKKSPDGFKNRDERQNSPAAKAIPGPGRWETLKRLYPLPFRALPTFLSEVAERYGPIATFAIPGRRFVFLNDPDLIKEALVTQQHAFVKSLGARTLQMLLGDGLLTSEDPLHRQMRRIVQPAFHRNRIEQYLRSMQRIGDDFVSRLVDGESLDMHQAMNELTLRIAGETLFGVDAEHNAREVRDALREAMETYPYAIGPIGKLRRSMPWLRSTRRFNRARATLDRIIYALIDERRKDRSKRSDALSLLLEAEDAETGYRLSNEQVRDEAMTLFLAGHETTANALLWTWYQLAKYPHVEARLHEEVDDISGGSNPVETLSRLQYTARVVRESMRLYPPAWIIGREARHDVVLGGYRVTARTTVFICPLVLHRSSRFYPNPQVFDPDRWVDFDPPQFAYVPFGGGARRCIGEEFAWAETTLMLATLAKRFTFTLDGISEVETDPLVTLRPRGAVPMRASARCRSKIA